MTWSVHLNLLCLPDPLTLLEGALWPKQAWKDLCLSKVIYYQKRRLKNKAAANYKLSILNVQTLGLTGRSHSSLHCLLTTQDVKIARPHLKILARDYMCYYFRWKDIGYDPQCCLCPSSENLLETITHIFLVPKEQKAVTQHRCFNSCSIYN